MPVTLSDSYESLVAKAAAYMGSGDTEQAIQTLRRVVTRLTRLRPETIAKKEKLQGLLLLAWRNMVALLRAEGLYDEAIAVTRDVYKSLADILEHDDVVVGCLEVEKGDVEQGIARLQRAWDDDHGNLGALRALADSYLYLGQCDEAVSLLRQALDQVSDNASAALVYYKLFEAYKNLGQVEEAVDAWNMGAVLAPDFGDAVDAVYRWLIDCGEIELAERYLEREDNELLRLLHQGIIEYRRGNRRGADERWRRVVNSDMRTVADAEAGMEASLWLDEAEPVLDLVDQILDSRVPLVESAMAMAAIAEAMLGRLEEAERWLKDAQIYALISSLPARKLPASKWKLFNERVSDPQAVQLFAPYFETGSPCREAAESAPE